MQERAAGALAYYTGVFGAVEVPERRPPSYAAYLAFQDGVRYGNRLETAAADTAFRRALELDLMYTEAYLLLTGMVLYRQPGRTSARGGYASRFDVMDSLARMMRQAIRPLTEADRAVLNWIEATARGDNDAALAASVTGSVVFREMKYGIGFDAINSNRPAMSVEALRALDPDRGWLRDDRLYWAFMTDALHMLGRYTDEAAAVTRGRTRFPDLVATELRARIAQAQLDELRPSLRRLAPATRLALALELRAHGHGPSSDSVLAELVEWYGERPQDSPVGEHLTGATALRLTGRVDEAIAIMTRLVARDTLRLDFRGILGTLHARSGNGAAAQGISQQLAAVNEPYLHGLVPVWRARIAALLGDREQAVRLLHDAFREGWRHGTWLHRDVDLESLRGFGPYRDLVRPR